MLLDGYKMKGITFTVPAPVNGQLELFKTEQRDIGGERSLLTEEAEGQRGRGEKEIPSATFFHANVFIYGEK